MNSKKPVTIKRSPQPQALPQRRSQLIQESDNDVESTQQLEIEQPEQPEPELYIRPPA